MLLALLLALAPAHAATVRGIVYDDLNANNAHDPGEPGIPNVAPAPDDVAPGPHTARVRATDGYGRTSSAAVVFWR